MKKDLPTLKVIVQRDITVHDRIVIDGLSQFAFQVEGFIEEYLIGIDLTDGNLTLRTHYGVLRLEPRAANSTMFSSSRGDVKVKKKKKKKKEPYDGWKRE